jgi:6-phosphogluconolactonase
MSMYPGCPQIAQPTGAVVALRDPPMNPAIDRLSFTPPMLEHARMVVVLAFGAGKAKALARALDPGESPERLPAKLVARTGGRLVVLADRAAAPV